MYKKKIYNSDKKYTINQIYYTDCERILNHFKKNKTTYENIQKDLLLYLESGEITKATYDLLSRGFNNEKWELRKSLDDFSGDDQQIKFKNLKMENKILKITSNRFYTREIECVDRIIKNCKLENNEVLIVEKDKNNGYSIYSVTLEEGNNNLKSLREYGDINYFKN